MPVNGYVVPIDIAQSAASAVDTTVWSLTNGTTRPLIVTRFRGIVLFSGTATAANTQRYKLVRTTAGTPSGGTAITPVKKRTSLGASGAADSRFLDTGLTTSGVTFGDVLQRLALPASATGVLRAFDFDFSREPEFAQLYLDLSQGLALRLDATAVVGFGLSGFLEYQEIT